MKNILFISALLLGFFTTSFAQKVKGSGPAVTRSFSLASFNTIECNLAADVEITQGSTQSVTVEGQENIIALISKEVKDNKWRIKLPKGTWSDYDKLLIKITIPEVHGLGLAGSGNITTMNKIKADDFQIGLSGSGNIKADVDAENIDCGISGSGNVMIKGKAKELTIGTSGSGNVKAADCIVDKVKIGISGSGDCLVNANENLEASIAGSGSVKYKGRPRVKSSISGSGSINSIE
ncbi:MAG: head GIN domain-containing protein [Saprospiraceae bacterium]